MLISHVAQGNVRIEVDRRKPDPPYFLMVAFDMMHKLFDPNYRIGETRGIII